MLGDPRLDLIEPVIGLRQDKSQPDDAHLAQTQSGSVAVRWKVLVNQFDHTHLQQKRNDDRDIINSFVDSTDLFGHSASIAQFSKP